MASYSLFAGGSSRAGRPRPHERNIFAPLFGENPSDGHVCNAEEVVWICAQPARDCDAAGSAGGFNRDACRCADGRKEPRSIITLDHYYEPLPQETGAAGLKLMLRRLQTTGRLMQVDAHPDDEDGGMLTLEARGKGVSTLLMTLTRGEGGQNELGSNLFDVLGVVRTLEVLAADRYYGVEQRFSRVADFGYSKTPEETFQKWQGHDIPLGDIVRVIRTFRPDVLIARFSGTERDGHGHHQASAILTKEAFRAAADPKRFPEQIKEGLAALAAEEAVHRERVRLWGVDL